MLTKLFQDIYGAFKSHKVGPFMAQSAEIRQSIQYFGALFNIYNFQETFSEIL